MSGALPASRLHVITLGVRDREMMSRFYEEGLGLKRMDSPGITHFDMGGMVLGLWEIDKLAQDSGLEAPPPAPAGFTGFTLAYLADSEAQVDEILQRVARLPGAKLTKPAHKAFWGGYSGCFADPEGHVWEIAFNPFWPVNAQGHLDL